MSLDTKAVGKYNTGKSMELWQVGVEPSRGVSREQFDNFLREFVPGESNLESAEIFSRINFSGYSLKGSVYFLNRDKSVSYSMGNRIKIMAAQNPGVVERVRIERADIPKYS